MSNFDIAFDRAIAKTSPVPMSDLKNELGGGTGPLEEMFHTVDHFSYDPTRLVVSATVVGEQYRSLKTNLTLFKDTEGVGSVVFSSSLKDEGKTTVVVNTAREFGHERGAKVAVVDCDFKRPGVARLCGVECHAGIEDVLAEEAELE
ncbi:MAG: hypothetical protein J7M19_01770, partial [Planctomycetes bacterium]|nr:hypothetical protein [Planctomycetota bacterium]